MIVRLDLPSPVLPGDLVLRPKASGFGFHYGTGIRGGYVAHTTPGIGKHVSALNEFGDRKAVTIIRPQRTPMENFVVERAAMSDLGKPYDGWGANCEHDAHRTHTGNAQSPTVHGIKLLDGAALVIGLIKAFSDD